MVDSLLLALSFVVSLFFSFVFDFRVLRQFIVCDNVMVSEMVPEFLVALNRDLLPCLCLFHFHSHKLIIEGIKKKNLFIVPPSLGCIQHSKKGKVRGN